jgi:hypothetical protein
MDLHEKNVGKAENKAFGIAKLAPDSLSQFDARS